MSEQIEHWLRLLEAIAQALKDDRLPAAEVLAFKLQSELDNECNRRYPVDCE